MNDNCPELSVVIGFKDWGLERLAGAVRSLAASLSGLSAEIIVSDYGSVGDVDAVRQALENLGAVYVYTATNGVWSRSRALNAGLQVARGKHLVTTDADMVFTPKCFHIVSELLQASSGAYYLLQCRDLPEGIDHPAIESGKYSWQELNSISRLRPRWGMGGMIAFSRESYLSVRGLDERMEIYGGEDIDLAKRFGRIGLRRIWIEDSEARMFHVWHPSSKDEAMESDAGKAAMGVNRAIHTKDKTAARNLNHWEFAPNARNPLVSVAMSTMNRGETISDAIHSVLGQTMGDLELIVIDDGSTDDTRDIVASFDDPRIRYIYQENRGLAAARNKATSVARGKYIAVHDDDDIMLPWRIESCLDAVVDGAQGSYGGWVDFDNATGDLTYFPGKKVSLPSLVFNVATYLHPTLMVDRRVMEAVPYQETMRSGSDYNLAVRLIRSGVHLNHCLRYVLLRRRHGGQITAMDSPTQKSNGLLSSYFARSTFDRADVARERQGRAEADKAHTESAKKAEPFLIPFLPDHLVERKVSIPAQVDPYVAKRVQQELRGRALVVRSFDGTEIGSQIVSGHCSLRQAFKVARLGMDTAYITGTVRDAAEDADDLSRGTGRGEVELANVRMLTAVAEISCEFFQQLAADRNVAAVAGVLLDCRGRGMRDMRADVHLHVEVPGLDRPLTLAAVALNSLSNVHLQIASLKSAASRNYGHFIIPREGSEK